MRQDAKEAKTPREEKKEIAMPYEGEDPPGARFAEPPPELDRLAWDVIGAAIAVHIALGPGQPEKAYEGAMAIELTDRGIPFERQRRVPILYKEQCVAVGVIDLLVGGRLVVELKAVEAILPIHRLRTRSYMRMINEKLGLLINFDVPILKQGEIRRVVDTVD